MRMLLTYLVCFILLVVICVHNSKAHKEPINKEVRNERFIDSLRNEINCLNYDIRHNVDYYKILELMNKRDSLIKIIHDEKYKRRSSQNTTK